MTLDQFKEKLFRKANMFSVTLDYLGTKYQVGYYTPNDNEEIKAIVEYRHGQKEPYCVELDIYRNKNWKIVQINPEANKYNDKEEDVQNFIDKVEKLGVLDE